MKYKRDIYLQSCHFNGLQEYEDYEKALNDHNLGNYASSSQLFKQCLLGTHGHNFKVSIEANGPMSKQIDKWGGCFLIDDIELVELVLQWNNKNVSVLPEFFDMGLRATTENMAKVLLHKLELQYPNVCFCVSIWENPTIVAVVKSGENACANP